MDIKQGFSNYLEFSTLDLYLNAATKNSVIPNPIKDVAHILVVANIKNVILN